jgi:hypothetical protein
MSLPPVFIKQTLVKTPTPVSEALAKNASLFGLRAFYLLLATDRIEFRPWSAFDHNLDGVYSLTICDAQTELRLEKEPFKPLARYRSLQERATAEAGFSEVFRRTSSYALRRPIHPHPAGHSVIDYPGDQVKLLYQEYFAPNEVGWLTLTAARLAGLDTGER